MTKVAELFESLVGFQPTLICCHTPVFSKKEQPSHMCHNFYFCCMFWFHPYDDLIQKLSRWPSISALSVPYSLAKAGNPSNTHYTSKAFLLLLGTNNPTQTKKNFQFLFTTTLQLFQQPIPCCLLAVLGKPLLSPLTDTDTGA